MKFCINCGTQLQDDEMFCSNCGTKQNEESMVDTPVVEEQAAPVEPQFVPVEPQVEPIQPQAMPVQAQNNKKEKKPKDPNKKSNKKAIIISIVAAVLVLTLAVGAILTFPLKASVETEAFTTKTNLITKEFEVSSNQAINEVYYALNPVDPNNLKEYEKVKEFSGTFTAKFELKNLAVAPGNGKIYFIVDTMFGQSSPVSVNYTYDMGYFKAVNPDKVDEDYVSEGLGICTDRLIISFNEKMGDKQLNQLAEKYNGMLVGVNYFTNEAQFEFAEENVHYIMDEIRNEELVEDVNYEYVFRQELDPVEDMNDGEAEVDDRNNNSVVTPRPTEEMTTTEWVPETTTQ